MADNPVVSVIIPVYNGERYLAEAIQSVLDQTLVPDEIIVVDDGSTDATAQIIAGLAVIAPVPIRYSYQTNRGPAAARNRGVQLATADITAFLDADDLWGDKLAIQIPLLTAQPDTQIVWGKIQEFEMDEQQRLTVGQPLYGPHVGSVLMRRAAFERVGAFDESMRFGEDLDWLLRSRELGLPYILHPDLVLWYRHHANNTWLGQPKAFDKNLTAIKKRLDRQRLRQMPAIGHSAARSGS
jgi:glycosyltransferase involved in cell wall biosynthesis